MNDSTHSRLVAIGRRARALLGLVALCATSLAFVATSRQETCTASPARTARLGGTCGLSGVVPAPTDGLCRLTFDAGALEGLPSGGELVNDSTFLSIGGCVRALDGGLLPLPDGGVRSRGFGANGGACSLTVDVSRQCSGRLDGGAYTLQCTDDGAASCELTVELSP